jgi:proline iminopeptidase
MNPDKYTLGEHFIEVGDGHTLYVHDWGKKDAKHPIIFLHGGPGAGVKDKYKQVFDPTTERVIFFDQRGCGKSVPAGSVEHNTTKEMIEDIKKIADELKLKSYIMNGGSWGSCLALAYALKYPDDIYAMVLRGIYTASKFETDYLDDGEIWRVYFPEAWQAYLDRTPKEHHADPTAYHFKQALGDDPVKAKLSAYAYGELESSLIQLDERHVPEDFETFDPNFAKIEMHYLANGCFLPERYILDNAHKLTMPIWLIQGRYDMVCPPITAYELNERLPNSNLAWTLAGHGNDRPNYDLNRALLQQLSK